MGAVRLPDPFHLFCAPYGPFPFTCRVGRVPGWFYGMCLVLSALICG